MRRQENWPKLLATIAGHRFEALYVLASTVAMRRGEILGLRWPDGPYRAAANEPALDGGFDRTRRQLHGLRANDPFREQAFGTDVGRRHDRIGATDQ
jgi:hypothetical protein